ncbi:hypothetical protein B0O80DRAFT_460952 [Mortierella sp. GBAus27b]|nr:hypothetical protein B0O80DRAFT_460952 [Mortierella sp. GBAus27b]
MSDLRALASAVTTANVAQMTMDGSHFKSPPLDVVNRGQRFNPILQLASNSRIQVFRLRGFENFGSRINKPALLSTPKLQLFTMELPENAKDMDLLFTNDILGHCLNLTTIELNLHPRCRIMKAISDILSKTRNIESLKVSRGDTLITAGDSKGMPKDMDMSMQQPEDPILHELKSMQNGRLCWMTVVLKDASRVELGDLKDILHHIPSLRHFRVGCPSFQSFFVVHNVIQTRRKIVEDTGSSCLRTFQLMNEDLIPFSPHGRGDLIQSYVSFQDNSTLLDMRTWIRGTDEEALLLMLIYRWSIVFFNTGLYGRQKCRDMLESINNSVELFQLEELWVAPDSTFLDSLHEIIRRSPMFKRLGLYVDLAQEADFEATRTILCQYGAILSTLHLSNYSFAGQQWSWFASSHPTRNSFPKLETLTLDSPSDTNLPSTCIPWVVAMVSAPSRVPIPSSHSQSSTEDTVDKQTPNVESEAQGSWTSLKRIDLCSLELPPEGWKSVIEAIDFSGLQILKFRKSNFSLKELELLVDCIPDDKTSNIPLQSLDISWTSAFSDPNSLPLLDELQRKAPLVAVYNEADTY